MIGDLGRRGIGWYLDPNNEKTISGMSELVSVGGGNFGNYAGLFLGSIYVISPIDFIPDYIPVIGHVDDLIVLRYSWRVGGAIQTAVEWIFDL